MRLFYMLLGCVLYSFADVVSTRVVRKMNFISDRSRCMYCNHVLNWMDIIPIFSYLFLKGRCRYCHHQIERRVFIVELLGLAAGLIFYHNLLGLLYSMLLLIIALIDYESQDVYLLSLIPLILIDLITIDDMNLYAHFIGAIMISMPMCFINLIKKDSFGSGDIYLEVVLGFYLGINNLICMIYSLVFCFIYSIFKRNRQKRLAFIPFIYLGYFTNYVICQLLLTT